MSSAAPAPKRLVSLRDIFAGRRGRLLVALLLSEFGGAVQGIAYSTVLPLASRELHGASLYGATLASETLATVFMLAIGPVVMERVGLGSALGVATVTFTVGVAMTVLAPAMIWVLLGSVVRGLGVGIVLGFGYTALGALYPDDMRPRVMGLFAVMWLLPSLVGPPINAAIAETLGWRWAMAWPAFVVIAARVVVWRSVAIIPPQEPGRRVNPAIGVGIVAALVLASWASSGHGASAWVGWGVGFVAATTLSIVLLTTAAGGARRRAAALIAFFGLNLSYFAAESVIPLSLVTALNSTVFAGGAAVGVAGVAWSVVGLIPARRTGRIFGRAPIGVVVMVAGLAIIGVAVGFGGPRAGLSEGVAIWLALAGAAVAGTGMGLAYTVQSSANFDDLAPDQVAPVATAAALAETGSIAIGSTLTGGAYSLATTAGAVASPVLATGFATLIVLGLATLVFTVAAVRPARTRGQVAEPVP